MFWKRFLYLELQVRSVLGVLFSDQEVTQKYARLYTVMRIRHGFTMQSIFWNILETKHAWEAEKFCLLRILPLTFSEVYFIIFWCMLNIQELLKQLMNILSS